MNSFARWLVYGIFLYTCIEGLVINIAYPAKGPYIYKDVAILLAYFLVVLGLLQRPFPPSAVSRKLTFFFVVFALGQIVFLAHPDTSLVAGLVALKQRLFYIPLFYLGYLFVRGEEDLRALAKILCVSAIPVSVFGIYLYFSGPEALREIGAHYSAEVLTPSELGLSYWRVPGSFTSPGQYGGYLLFHGLVVAALLVAASVTGIWRMVSVVALLCVLSAVFASGTRGTATVLLVAWAIVLLLTGTLKGWIGWPVAIFLIVALVVTYLGPSVSERFGTIATEATGKRLRTTYFGQLFVPILREHPMGLGLGAATIGVRHIGGGTEFMLVESYLGILVAETGFVGLATFLPLIIAAAVLLFRGRHTLDGSSVRILWYALLGYVLVTMLLLPVGTSIDHAPNNLYFWFTLGMLIRLADRSGPAERQGRSAFEVRYAHGRYRA